MLVALDSGIRRQNYLHRSDDFLAHIYTQSKQIMSQPMVTLKGYVYFGFAIIIFLKSLLSVPLSRVSNPKV